MITTAPAELRFKRLIVSAKQMLITRRLSGENASRRTLEMLKKLCATEGKSYWLWKNIAIHFIWVIWYSVLLLSHFRKECRRNKQVSFVAFDWRRPECPGSRK